MPTGKYTLWSFPTPAGFELIIKSQTGQWRVDYDMKRDLARLDTPSRTIPKPVGQFTLVIGA
ncbi:MAG TPA: DUF2911 domain-containing protein, partial [Gemmatimonadaceae bacterium]|nr:DUF2911 domain-containing protein [Gemmatimonadaceae bacterium]